ncbi:MAG: DUF2304 domain-containing protein, partial [Myxococcota bacterium]|nr:DUF2304 domain-containing protein [Myxococcota bacterium]
MHLPLLLASIALLLAVLELVRRRKLREEFSWLWVAGASGALLLSCWVVGRAALTDLLGTSTEELALVAASILFVAMVCLDISTKVSRMANQQKNLVQAIARLEKRVG